MFRVVCGGSLVGVALLLGCAKINASYQETDSGTSGGVSTGPNSSRGSDSGGRPPDPVTGSTSPGTTSLGTTGAGDTIWGSTSTGPIIDMGSGLSCTVPLGKDCDTTAQNCPLDGETCAPFTPELGGVLQGTYCLPVGPVAEGQRCEPRCKGDEMATCGAGLVCDVFLDRSTACRPTCDDGEGGCTDGVCFREPTANGVPLAICRGTCSPTDLLGCGFGEVCRLGEDGVPDCETVDSPGQAGDDCSIIPCGIGLVCAPADSGPCTDTECCAAACNPFSAAPCPKGDVCVSLPIPAVAEAGIGYCSSG